MEGIEERDVAAKIWKCSLDIVKAKFDVTIGAGRDLGATTDLPFIQVETKNWLRAGAFPQIEGEQSHPATDIEDRLSGTA
jgi:hypothetical protein